MPVLHPVRNMGSQNIALQSGDISNKELAYASFTVMHTVCIYIQAIIVSHTNHNCARIYHKTLIIALLYEVHTISYLVLMCMQSTAVDTFVTPWKTHSQNN